MPRPSDRDAVRKALWEMLGTRLKARRDQGVPLGVSRQMQWRNPRGGMETRHEDVTTIGNPPSALIDMFGPLDAEETRALQEPHVWLLDECWEYVRRGVLRPMEHSNGVLMITPYGARCIERDDSWNPLDTTGLVTAFENEFAGLPNVPLMAKYLSQAVECHRFGLELAGATMIGCAYEIGVNEIADEIVRIWRDPRQITGLDDEEKQNLYRQQKIRRQQPTGPPSIGHVASGTFKGLKYEADLKTGAITFDDWSWAESGFESTFALVRRLRNKAGHPSGANVANDDVWGHILMLRAWYRRIRSIVGSLSTLGDNLRP